MIEFIYTFFCYAQLFTVWLIIVCGSLFLILAALMLGSEAIRRIMEHVEGYAMLIDFIWYREDFKKWMADKQNKGE